MALAVRDQIFAFIEQVLTSETSAREVERMPPGEPRKFDALHIFDEGDEPDPGETGTNRFALSVGIDGYVEGGEGREAHSALNSLYADTVAALFTEPVLGGLATEIEISRFKPLVTERASARRMAFDLGLTIYYATRRGDPRTIQS